MNDLDAVMRVEVAHQYQMEERQIGAVMYRYLLSWEVYGPMDWFRYQPLPREGQSRLL